MSESAIKVAVHRGLKALSLRISEERATLTHIGLLTSSAPTSSPRATDSLEGR